MEEGNQGKLESETLEKHVRRPWPSMSKATERQAGEGTFGLSDM